MPRSALAASMSAAISYGGHPCPDGCGVTLDRDTTDDPLAVAYERAGGPGLPGVRHNRSRCDAVARHADAVAARPDAVHPAAAWTPDMVVLRSSGRCTGGMLARRHRGHAGCGSDLYVDAEQARTWDVVDGRPVEHRPRRCADLATVAAQAATRGRRRQWRCAGSCGAWLVLDEDNVRVWATSVGGRVEHAATDCVDPDPAPAAPVDERTAEVAAYAAAAPVVDLDAVLCHCDVAPEGHAPGEGGCGHGFRRFRHVRPVLPGLGEHGRPTGVTGTCPVCRRPGVKVSRVELVTAPTGHDLTPGALVAVQPQLGPHRTPGKGGAACDGAGQVPVELRWTSPAHAAMVRDYGPHSVVAR